MRQAIAAALLAVAVVLSAPAAAADPVVGFSVNSSGNFVANQEVNALWRLNLQTGIATRVFDAVRDDTGYLDLEALAFDRQGRLFGADDESKTLVRVGTSSGRAVTVSPPEQSNMGVPLSPPLDFGMTFTCDDQLLVVSATEQSLFEADIQTGTLNRLGAAGALGVALADLATRDEVIYAIDMGQTAAGPTAEPALYRLSVNPVAVERIGPLGAAVLPYRSAGLAFDEQGQLWAVTNRRNINNQDFPSQIIRIDTETGTAQAVAETQVANDDAVVAGQPLVGLESLAIGPPALCGASNDPNPSNAPVASPRSSDWDASPIPALSPPMLLLLTLLLGILGALALNMQRRQGDPS